MEALALENNLIKQRTPRYNILLRDDKNYPYLRLTTGEAFPRVLVARGVEEGSADFFAGPFLPAKLARRTMALTHRLFGIRSCNEVITGQRARPCLEYDIKRCVAPCVREICSETDYARGGRQHPAAAGRPVRRAGRRAARPHGGGRAEAERYEEAAQLRDAMRTVQALRRPPAEGGHRAARSSATSSASRRDRAAPSCRCSPCADGRVVERVELAGQADALPGTSRRRGGRARAVLRRARAAGRSRRSRGPRGAGRARGLAHRARRPPGARARAAARGSPGDGGPGDAQRRAVLPHPVQRTPRWRTSTRSRRCAPCSACRRCRAGSSASTSRRSRAARRWRRWWCARTGG